MRKAILQVLGAVFICALMLIGYDQFVAAAVVNNTGQLQKDSNSSAMQVAPDYSLIDNSAIVAAVTTMDLTSNVVTVTTGTHGYVVGQRVVVLLLTGPTLFADVNGTFLIASVPGATSFTYAFTHANIASGASTGSTTAYMASPMPTNTTSLVLKFPAKAVHCILRPLTANATLYRVTARGGSTQSTTDGALTLYAGVDNHVNGLEGDTVYVARGTTTVLEFAFDLLR